MLELSLKQQAVLEEAEGNKAAGELAAQDGRYVNVWHACGSYFNVACVHSRPQRCVRSRPQRLFALPTRPPAFTLSPCRQIRGGTWCHCVERYERH